MHVQKQEILEFVEGNRKERSVRSMLRTFGVSTSSYYRWKAQASSGVLSIQKIKINPRQLSARERELILEVKSKNPLMRHRRIAGEIQKEGLFVSATTVYKTLKNEGKVEPYARRESPWNEPHYEIIGANMMWGADWTKIRINHTRWYLLTLIDFYSRLIVAYAIVPNVNSSHIKSLYLDGLSSQNIPINWHLKPTLRTDRGSPNTSRVTKSFFKDIESDLSLARVRRPTDNAITERFYSTIKQEEIYVVESYPDLQSAIDEIGRYIRFYNEQRPHQSLWNFTPQYVHELNNKTEILRIRKEIKQNTLNKRKEYWNSKKMTY